MDMKGLVEAELERAMSELDRSPIGPTARYGVFPGGKRIRPVLALSWCRDLGGDPQAVVSAAAALELLHCASLMHDDLPALDNDDFRRGRPSCHRAFGEASAILAGDALVTVAIDLASSGEGASERRLAMVRAVAGAFTALCIGQVFDLAVGPARPDLETIHRYKTGALFGACFEVGALGAGVGDDVVAESVALGYAVGLAFQIADDFLDLHGTDVTRGRPGSSDTRNGKPNFFTAPGDPAGAVLARTRRDIDSALRKLAPSGARFVRPLIDGVLAPLPLGAL